MANLMTVFRDLAAVDPAPYGLLSPAVTVIRDSEDHWQGGFQYRKGTGITVDNISTDGFSASASVVQVESTGASGVRHYLAYHPFIVEARIKVSTFGNTREEVEAMVDAYIEAATQKAVEREFWSGQIAKADGDNPNRYLASDDATDVTPAASATGIKTKFGLALLEDALAGCGIGERGVIHATRGVASALGIKGSNGRIETPIGNFLVAGTGYTGAGPDGVNPAGTPAYMYATGPVTVRLGPVIPLQDSQYVVNSSENTIEYHVSRSAAVTWSNDCHYAVLVDLTQDYS